MLEIHVALFKFQLEVLLFGLDGIDVVCNLQDGSTWHFHFLAIALGHDIAGTAHQLSHYIFILQEKFFPPSDKPEGMIFQPISKPKDVELHGDKVSYCIVGELLTTTSFNPSPMLMPAVSRNAWAKSSKVFWRLK